MASNKVHDGWRVPYTTPSGGVDAGDIVVLGSMFGVAMETKDESVSSELHIGGVWDLTKKTGDTFAVGALVYWDATNKRCTSTSTDNTKIGVAVVAGASADTTLRVRVNANFV